MSAPPAGRNEPAPRVPSLPGDSPLAALPPHRLPIFPLSGVVLLPRTRLPLHIFEPRYVAMTRDAIAGLPYIGMVQPIPAAAGDKPPVFGIGCAGRIVEKREVGEGRLLIALAGVCRFQIVAELDAATPYRVVDASYAAFTADLGDEDAADIDLADLLRTVKNFLRRREFKGDLATISRSPAAELINWLVMVLPLSPSEKQALLQAAGLGQRALLLNRLLQLAALESPSGATGAIH